MSDVGEKTTSSPKVRPLGWACAAMGGSMVALPGHAGSTFTGVAIDSRQVKPGSLFFALPGERVDGFDFWGNGFTRKRDPNDGEVNHLLDLDTQREVSLCLVPIGCVTESSPRRKISLPG